MKRLLILTAMLFLGLSSQAHYMWLEVKPQGDLDKSHEVRVYYGEYTYGVIEAVDGEAFQKVSDFSLWLVAPSGERSQLQPEAGETYFHTSFIPKESGTYTVYLNNDNIEVIDYTQYDFGIFKTHYHAVAEVQVGNTPTATNTYNSDGLSLKVLPAAEGNLKLQIFYKSLPLADAEATLYIKDLWTKTLTTDETGILQTALPWDEKYILEITKKEEIPGSYKGEDYEFIWHCLTFTLPL